MKNGIKTTEFWLALVAMVLVAIPQVFNDASPWVKLAGIIGAALIAAGYGFSRALAKSSNGDSFVFEERE